MKLRYTTASAVKEKDGKLLCQAEVLCGGKLKSAFYTIVNDSLQIHVGISTFSCFPKQKQ